MYKILGFVVIFTLLEVIVCESGVCSWYGVGLDGALTASGEKYNGNAMTAAHKTLPFGTRVRATCNGRSITVRINDRGPFVAGRILDVSRAGAAALGITSKGVCQCNVVKA